MPKKSWTYRRITEASEEEIHRILKYGEGDLMAMQRAYGVYMGWCSITMGWQDASDNERLKSLCR